MLQCVSTPTVGHLQGALKFLYVQPMFQHMW